MAQTRTNFPTHDPSWDLDSIYEGGAESPAFFETVRALGAAVEELGVRARRLVSPADEANFDGEAWVAFLLEREALLVEFGQARAFAGCVASAHTDDPRALRLPSVLNDVQTKLGGLMVDVRARLRGLSAAQFERLRGLGGIEHMDLALREMRREADEAMDPALEVLAVELNRDGLHAWGQLYDQATARLEVEIVEGDGARRTMSVGQAKNLTSNPDREVRRQAHEGLTAAWQKAAPVCAQALSSIIGAEQTLYRRRGTDALTAPLAANRVERATVEAIMEAAAGYRGLLVEYMQLKARLLGLEQLEWFDLYAPVGGGEVERIGYEQAQRMIVEQVGQFSPRMADFCAHALASQWVEVEDRPGKAQGGFCTTLAKSGEIRIFMTFGGTASGVQTLAHELGHGYHGWLMRGLPYTIRRVPMTLAETASTLAEALVEEAALARAEGEAKLRLLDERLGRAIAFLVDVPARYRLELALHEQRAGGALDEELLGSLTRDIFGQAFGEGVASVDSLFWASKLHFYLTSLPFYNFPYTFGYLFSKAIHARAEAEGPAFAAVVDDLLMDTGRMTAEALASKYLGADLRKPEFWSDAAASLRTDVAQYRRLVEGRVGNG